jgi:hypothetical protein
MYSRLGNYDAASRLSARGTIPEPFAVSYGVAGPDGMVWIQGGEFLMGSDHELARPPRRCHPKHRGRRTPTWSQGRWCSSAPTAPFRPTIGPAGGATFPARTGSILRDPKATSPERTSKKSRWVVQPQLGEPNVAEVWHSAPVPCAASDPPSVGRVTRNRGGASC